jgi:hypothetical protein
MEAQLLLEIKRKTGANRESWGLFNMLQQHSALSLPGLGFFICEVELILCDVSNLVIVEWHI